MAKKIKFPLKMADGSQVRNIEELREHFDLTVVLGYYASGRLIEWLTDRYYDVEAEKIKALESSSKEFKKNLCQILAVPYSETGADDVDLADIAAKNERYERLKQFTADDTILAAVDLVAFTQEDLADLLDKDAKLIYLCGERFNIPCSKSGVTYIGVNDPIVEVEKRYRKRGIVFKDIQGANILDESIKSVFISDPDSFEDLPNDMGKKAAKQGNQDALFTLTMKTLKSTMNELTDTFAEAIDVFKPLEESEGEFRMVVDSIHVPFEGALSVAGIIEKGCVKTTDRVRVTKKNGTSFTEIVFQIVDSNGTVNHAEEGDLVGILLCGAKLDEISVGDVLTKLTSSSKKQNTKESLNPVESTEVKNVAKQRFIRENKDSARNANIQFKLTIQNIIEIRDRETVVEGVIEKGSIQLDDEVMITKNGVSFSSVVQRIDRFQKSGDFAIPTVQAKKGAKVKLYLINVKTYNISKGDLVTKT